MITEEQIQATGLVDNPYYVPVEVRDTEYGKYSDRIKKQITKHFFPRTHDALKVIAESRHGFKAPDGYNEDEAVRDLRAALSSDIADKQKEEELDRKQAKLMADANNGNKEAQLQIMTDQTANVYGPEDDDDEDEFDDDDEDDDDSSDEGIEFINAIRHGRAMEIAAALGIQR